MVSKSEQRRLVIQKYKDLPKDVVAAVFEEDPSWDWIRLGDYLILRVFDDGGEELDRFVSKVIHVVSKEELEL